MTEQAKKPQVEKELIGESKDRRHKIHKQYGEDK